MKRNTRQGPKRISVAQTPLKPIDREKAIRVVGNAAKLYANGASLDYAHRIYDALSVILPSSAARSAARRRAKVLLRHLNTTPTR